LCTTTSDDFPFGVSASVFSICTLSYNSEVRETSLMFPLARSNKNFVGFMEISGLGFRVHGNKMFYQPTIAIYKLVIKV